MAGDSLARGAKSQQFAPAQVSQAKWDSIFNSEKEKPTNKKPLKTVWSK